MATVAPAAVSTAESPATRTRTSDREPAPAVHQHAEQQPGRAAEDPGAGHPPDPGRVGAAAVHHRAQQAAHRAQELAGHWRPGHMPRASGPQTASAARITAGHGGDRGRPDHLGEPGRRLAAAGTRGGFFSTAG